MVNKMENKMVNKYYIGGIFFVAIALFLVLVFFMSSNDKESKPISIEKYLGSWQIKKEHIEENSKIIFGEDYIETDEDRINVIYKIKKYEDNFIITVIERDSNSVLANYFAVNNEKLVLISYTTNLTLVKI